MDFQNLKQYIKDNGIDFSPEQENDESFPKQPLIDFLETYQILMEYNKPLNQIQLNGFPHRISNLAKDISLFRNFVGYPLYNKICALYPDVPLCFAATIAKFIQGGCDDIESLAEILSVYPRYWHCNPISFQELILVLDADNFRIRSSECFNALMTFSMNLNIDDYQKIILKNTFKRIIYRAKK